MSKVLVEALREGRKKYPKQIRSHLYKNGGACALGAIAAGLGIEIEGRTEVDTYIEINEKFKDLGFRTAQVWSIWYSNDNQPFANEDLDLAVIELIEEY